MKNTLKHYQRIYRGIWLSFPKNFCSKVALLGFWFKSTKTCSNYLSNIYKVQKWSWSIVHGGTFTWRKTKICSWSFGRIVLIMAEIDFARYADDHTPYFSNYSIEDLIKILKNRSLNLFKWFMGNPLETNNKKYYQISLN